MSVWDLIYPKECLGCRRKGKYWCDGCLKTVEVNTTGICAECNKGSFGGRVHLGCRRRLGMEGVVGLYQHEGLVRLGIKGVKYRFLKDMEEEWRRLIGVGLKRFLVSRQGGGLKKFLKKKPKIVEVPLHWRRYNWRGFNQAEIIARILSEMTGFGRLEKELVRKKATKVQVKLDKEERRKNIRQAFEVKGDLSGVRRVLIVDDVWTTGATMREAVKALKKAGVSEVWGLTLAR